MKTQTFILLLAFVLGGNVLAAQGKYEYVIIGNAGVKEDKWSYSQHDVAKYEEKNTDKLEVQTIDLNSLEKPIQKTMKSYAEKGWELFHINDKWFYLRRLKK